MPITVTCECGKTIQTKDENAGRHFACKECGRELVVPKADFEPYDAPLTGPAETKTSGKAITSLVLGIFSFFCALFTGIPAIIFGALGLSDIGKSHGRIQGKGMAITGIIMGSIGSLWTFAVLIALLLPAVQAAREAARRAQCTNNLRQIALGLNNILQKDDHFPAAAITDAAGKPLLSWRVAILPYIGQEGLYKQFKLDEPWDSPANQALIAQIPTVYACPSEPITGIGMTHYQAITGTGTVIELTKGASLAEITDGTQNTLLVVEGANPVPWTKPDDIDINAIPTSLGSKHPGGGNAMFADGSVRFLKRMVPPAILKALATKDGGEVISTDAY